MKRHSIRTLGRSLALLGTTIIMVGGVTYAALQSQPGVVRGNTIMTAIASLQVSNGTGNYSNSLEGYTFGNLIPGGQPSPNGGYPVFVKNNGTSALSLRISIGGQLVNTDNVDLTKVHLHITPFGGGAPAQKFSFKELIDMNTTGGLAVNLGNRMTASQILPYTLQVSLDADAVNGPSATLSNVDIIFGGVAVN